MIKKYKQWLMRIIILIKQRLEYHCAMLRTTGEAGIGNVVEAVRHARTVNKEIKRFSAKRIEGWYNSRRPFCASHGQYRNGNCLKVRPQRSER